MTRSTVYEAINGLSRSSEGAHWFTSRRTDLTLELAVRSELCLVVTTPCATAKKAAPFSYARGILPFGAIWKHMPDPGIRHALTVFVAEEILGFQGHIRDDHDDVIFHTCTLVENGWKQKIGF